MFYLHNYVGNFYTIELGLYIPMTSLLKRALGLFEQASWMLIRPKRIYNFCLLHAYFGDIAICFDALSYLFITYFGTNILIVARVHKFLFLYFMCRNYLDKGKIIKKSLVGVGL